MVVKFTPQRLRAGGLLGVLAAAVLIAGCGSSNSSSSASAAPSTSAAAPAAPSSSAVTISTTKGPVGTYLTGASGRAIYLWKADTGAKSNCTGQCAKFWPPVLAKATPTVSGGATASDLGTTTRADGTKQVTYKGHPLYYFFEDPKAGTVKGQGSSNFGAKWWLVAPSGTAITAKGSSSSSGGGASGGGSGYGGSAY
jgi:predicted lipoprotein with Yx(FWY)xxD motif